MVPVYETFTVDILIFLVLQPANGYGKFIVSFVYACPLPQDVLCLFVCSMTVSFGIDVDEMIKTLLLENFEYGNCFPYIAGSCYNMGYDHTYLLFLFVVTFCLFV